MVGLGKRFNVFMHALYLCPVIHPSLPSCGFHSARNCNFFISCLRGSSFFLITPIFSCTPWYTGTGQIYGITVDALSNVHH
ncbi:hypothetical protein COCON_G00233680 [Conger conger]|uniref:Uncharacterized protein n=1 Tax=Conger conger TaxID=82655 RepID=A0A9Q1CUU6_CONCO|nr:hypothetical protein COCON_G00233680 [Conger conger]